MALAFLKHKWQKVTLISVTVFVVALFILAFFVNRYWSPILSNKLKSIVLSSSDSLYKIDFSSAELEVLNGKIIIYNIDLKPDTAVYNRRKLEHLAPNNLIGLHVKRLVLSHIHPFKLYFRHVLDIGRISINSPEVRMSYQLNHTKDTVNKDQRTVWQKISKSLKYIHVGDIFLNDINFRYDDYSGNKVAVSELKQINVQANDLLIDSATQTDKSRLLYCKDIIADLNNYKGTAANGKYTYAVKRIKLSTRTSQLNVSGITIDPVKNFFNKSRKDRFTVQLDSLQVNNFDFLSYHKYRSFTASSMLLSRGVFELFSNPNGIKVNNDKITSFPNVALYLIKTDIKIDTVVIRHVDVNYSEHNKKSNQDGTISFNNTHGRLLNITTDSAALQKNRYAKAELSTRFMNRGKLDIFFNFDLLAKDAAYSYKVTLGTMDLRAINPATMPFAMVKITSGTLKELSFDFNANRKASKGKVKLLYNDLKVNIMRADTTNAVLKKKLIVTLFANLFILKHDNPDKPGEIPRTFNVNYQRPINSPFFKTIWQSLLAGLKPAVGYDGKTQHMAKARMDQGELNKKNRVIKKAMRKQRRAERKLKREMKKQQKEAEKN